MRRLNPGVRPRENRKDKNIQRFQAGSQHFGPANSSRVSPQYLGGARRRQPNIYSRCSQRTSFAASLSHSIAAAGQDVVARVLHRWFSGVTGMQPRCPRYQLLAAHHPPAAWATTSTDECCNSLLSSGSASQEVDTPRKLLSGESALQLCICFPCRSCKAANI